jgi:SP family sugar:H+ symporter-like MFS transporter
MNEPLRATEVNATGDLLQAQSTTAIVLDSATRSTYAVVLSAIAAIGGFLFGFDSGVINGAVDALAHAFGTRAATTGFAVASVLLGCAVGAFVAGTIADRYGRRPTMLLNAGLFFLSAIATGLAGSAGVFIVSRLVGVWRSGPRACWPRCTFRR